MNENPCPKIKRNYSIVGHSNHLIELRKGGWSSQSYYIKDDSESENLYDILMLLDGKHSISTITDEVGAKKKSVEKIVQALKKEKILEEKPKDALSYYLDYIEPLLNDKHFPVVKKDILLIGDDKLCADVQCQLEDFLEQKNISCENYDVKKDNDFLFDDPAWPYHPLKKQAVIDRFSSWQKYFVVYLSKSQNPHVLQYFNLIATECELTWMCGLVDGPMLLAGPTFTKDTACFECFEKSVLQNMENAQNYQDYKKALAKGRFKKASYPLMKPIMNLLVSHVALEVINYITCGVNYTRGKCMSLYFPTMEMVYNEVNKISTCSACGIQIKPQANLYFDFEHLLQESDNVIYIHQ